MLSLETFGNIQSARQEPEVTAIYEIMAKQMDLVRGGGPHLMDQSSPFPSCTTLLSNQRRCAPPQTLSRPPTSQVSLNASSSLPDIPMSRSPPGTWNSSCSGWWSHSCCNCRPSHHTWNLEDKGRRLRQWWPRSSLTSPPQSVASVFRSTMPHGGDQV